MSDKLNWGVAKTTAPTPNTYNPLPAGEYVLEIDAATRKTSRDGNSTYIEVRYIVKTEPGKDRLVYEKYTSSHVANEEAVARGMAKLRHISMAAKGKLVDNASDLEGGKLLAELVIRKGGPKDTGGNWPDTNTIKSSRPLTAAIAPAKAVAAPQAAPSFDPLEDVIPF